MIDDSKNTQELMCDPPEDICWSTAGIMPNELMCDPPEDICWSTAGIMPNCDSSKHTGVGFPGGGRKRSCGKPSSMYSCEVSNRIRKNFKRTVNRCHKCLLLIGRISNACALTGRPSIFLSMMTCSSDRYTQLKNYSVLVVLFNFSLETSIFNSEESFNDRRGMPS